MSVAFLIQLGASALAVAALVGLAAWVGVPMKRPPLDDAAARRLMAIEFPGAAIDALWIASDGAGALARSGENALILFAVGDAYASRSLSWARASALSPVAGRLTLPIPDIAAPRASLAIAAWPPVGAA